ncbi:hypothetical protein AMAG_09345 [Allomyces macrogynus ATCC 38327]|uniref:Mitochondrial import inner membrane translocase subunit Tim21 n=1 Tax=Allomyces macrogynus (strain ATCC 38327) TaxID=578462 RepID=A0A0L0SP68_ALLM3|nr:hypothetical protein AMAG_09345 [Allomyces macrogynus ATCC 38327]|eukprot:KNE64316.1 hypothetical protein AMAG_09345 [Allomyces macrogynus ATCC 38327]
MISSTRLLPRLAAHGSTSFLVAVRACGAQPAARTALITDLASIRIQPFALRPISTITRNRPWSKNASLARSLMTSRQLLQEIDPTSAEKGAAPPTGVQTIVKAPLEGPPTMQSRLDKLRGLGRRVTRYAMVGAGLYVFYWFTSAISDFWIGFSLWDMGEIGFFVGGMLATGVLTGMTLGLQRFGVRSPAHAVVETVKRLEKDATLLQRIGAFKVAPYQAASVQGGIQFAQGWRGVYYPTYAGPKRLQLVFGVQGTHGNAVVSMDVSRRVRGHYVYKSLAVDIDKTGERLIYEGDDKSTVFKSLLRLR